ncbi:hypothetical protein C2E23DRAFT_889380 [Lenzites betulinus]|nr:hypothetical protein C2E23DRAFT_889380 [Lenzites betulinus]
MLTIARVVSFALLVLSLVCIAQASAASRREATNAERLKRGLGPARPRRLYSSSRTNVARSTPSGVPTGSAPTGVVALFTPGTSPASGASPIAWLGASTVVTSPSQAFGYQYTRSTTAPLAPVEINVLVTSDFGYRLGGVIPGLQGSTTLAPGNGAYVRIGNVNVHTVSGAHTGTYQAGGYVTAGFTETTIFQVDYSTGQITVLWVNADSSIKTYYAVLYSNALYLTGDVQAFYAKVGANPANGQVVDMYFAYPTT